MNPRFKCGVNPRFYIPKVGVDSDFSRPETKEKPKDRVTPFMVDIVNAMIALHEKEKR